MVNRMSTRNPLLALLCSLSISYVVSQDWSAVPWWGMGGTRSLYATSAPVAITKNLVYSLSNDTIIASNWRQRGAPAWVSDQLPGLFSNLPVLSTGGVASPDVVYVLAQDGRIYAFDADAGLNKTTPKWRSSFFCTSRVGQEKQVLTVDTTTNLLVARCYSSLVLMSLSTGRNLAYIKDQAIEPLNLPYTFPDKWTIATWRRNSINVWYAVSGYEGKLFRTHTVPDSSFSISSVAAGNGFLVVSGTASPVIYLIEKYGQYTVKYEFKPPGVTNPYVLPRPTIVNGVLYAVVRGTNGDQQVWSLVGLNVNTPRQPTLKFQRPAAEGTPPVQALTYSRNFIYVSEPAVGSQAFPRPNFAGYNMTTGELGWNNVRWSPDTTHPGLAAVTFCCDEMFVSSTIGNTAAARTTAFLRTLRASDGSTYFPSDPYNCTCTNEPAQNF